VEFIDELVNCWGSLFVSRCYEELVAEVGESLGTQRGGGGGGVPKVKGTKKKKVKIFGWTKVCVLLS
jgi:hypothetical protein